MFPHTVGRPIFLNLSNVDVLCLQHEFGIFGGPSGRHILTLLRNLRMPVVTTLHTILHESTPEQKRTLQEVVGLSTRVVTMTAKGAEFLREIYGTAAEKVDLIPHGIPDVPFIDPNYYKDKFGVEGRPVMLTFGLLSPNKGIENVLNALPTIISEVPGDCLHRSRGYPPEPPRRTGGDISPQPRTACQAERS